MATIFTSLENKIDAAGTCEDLQAVSTEITATITVMLAGVQAQIDALTALIVIPSANFGSILTWINAVIAVFKTPYDTYILQLVEIQAQLTALNAKIALKIEALDCTWTPP